MDVAWRSVCDRNQNGDAVNILFRGRSRDQDVFWVTKINWSTHFLRYLAGVATFCPLNSRRIKQSRALEQSDQAIKDDFHWSRFLIPVTNASTGDVYVTTPSSRDMANNSRVTYHTRQFSISRVCQFFSNKWCPNLYDGLARSSPLQIHPYFLFLLFNTSISFAFVSCSSNKRSHPSINLILKTSCAVGELPNLKSPILRNSQFAK